MPNTQFSFDLALNIPSRPNHGFLSYPFNNNFLSFSCVSLLHSRIEGIIARKSDVFHVLLPLTEYLAASANLSRFDFPWSLLLTLSIWPPLYFHSLSGTEALVSSLASTSALPGWESPSLPPTEALKFNRGSCGWR